MSHTPGPWLQSNSPSGFPILCTGPDGDLVTLDSVALDSDSRLAAAAPDLLEALKEASRFGNDFPDDVSIMVQDAIKKAEADAKW